MNKANLKIWLSKSKPEFSDDERDRTITFESELEDMYVLRGVDRDVYISDIDYFKQELDFREFQDDYEEIIQNGLAKGKTKTEISVLLSEFLKEVSSSQVTLTHGSAKKEFLEEKEGNRFVIYPNGWAGPLSDNTPRKKVKALLYNGDLPDVYKVFGESDEFDQEYTVDSRNPVFTFKKARIFELLGHPEKYVLVNQIGENHTGKILNEDEKNKIENSPRSQ